MIAILTLVVGAVLAGIVLGGFTLVVIGIRRRDREVLADVQEGVDPTAPFRPAADPLSRATDWVSGYFASNGTYHS